MLHKTLIDWVSNESAVGLPPFNFAVCMTATSIFKKKHVESDSFFILETTQTDILARHVQTVGLVCPMNYFVMVNCRKTFYYSNNASKENNQSSFLMASSK